MLEPRGGITGIRKHVEEDPRPGPLFEGNPVGEGTTRRGSANTRASSAKTRGFHTQLDEGPETP